VPFVKSERIVSMIGVKGWCSANPLSNGVIESVGPNDGLMKMRSSRT
jgi:hypothetical protein